MTDRWAALVLGLAVVVGAAWIASSSGSGPQDPVARPAPPSASATPARDEVFLVQGPVAVLRSGSSRVTDPLPPISAAPFPTTGSLDEEAPAPAPATYVASDLSDLARLGLTETGIVLRTSYDEARRWRTAWAQLTAESDEGFLADLLPVEDPALHGLSVDEALTLLPPGLDLGYVMVADERTVTDDEHPVVVVDLAGAGRFRAAASAVQQVENNLSIANMDFSEFAGAVDPDGVFRDF